MQHNLLMIDNGYLQPFLTAPSGRSVSGSADLAESRGVAVLQIYGPLAHRAQGGLMSMLFGEPATYEQIRANLREALADDSIGAIVLDVDSPGGEVAGVFDLVDEIYQARGTKPIYAMVNEAAMSAAYAIASAADQVFIGRTGQAGSIGVMALHVDQSGLDEKAGLKYTAIYAGQKKNDGNAHEPLSEAAAAEIQARVDEVYNLFVKTVARNRGLSIDEVKSTQAGIYSGREAIRAGLADDLKSYTDLISTLTRGDQMSLKTDLRALIAGKKPEDIAGAMAACGFIPSDQAQQDDKAQKIMDIVELCEVAGITDLRMVQAILDDGLDPKKAKAAILKAKAELAESGSIFSAVSATGTGEVNPLIADAKRRAGKE